MVFGSDWVMFSTEPIYTLEFSIVRLLAAYMVNNAQDGGWCLPYEHTLLGDPVDFEHHDVFRTPWRMR